MTRPLPSPTPDTKPYWDAAARHELQVPYCLDCGRPHFYPRPACPHCHGERLEWRRCSGRASLSSYIVNRRPLPAFELDGPQWIALVELEEGVRMTTNLVDVPDDPEAVRLDMPLEVRFVEAGGDLVLPVFAPAEAGR